MISHPPRTLGTTCVTDTAAGLAIDDLVKYYHQCRDINPKRPNDLTYLDMKNVVAGEDATLRSIRIDQLVRHLATLPVDALPQRHIMIATLRNDLLGLPCTIDPAELDVALTAMSTVPRELFVPAELKPSAYLPTAMDISYGQTISHPCMVALMTMAARVRPGARALDVGTGSGYQAAVLSRAAANVVSLEIRGPLAERAISNLRVAGIGNVNVVVADGSSGYDHEQPYDAIIVAAGAPQIPEALLDQLATGGRLVMPLGHEATEMQLVVATKSSTDIEYTSLGPARFVSLKTAYDDPPDHYSESCLKNLTYLYGIAVTQQ